VAGSWQNGTLRGSPIGNRIERRPCAKTIGSIPLRGPRRKEELVKKMKDPEMKGGLIGIVRKSAYFHLHQPWPLSDYKSSLSTRGLGEKHVQQSRNVATANPLPWKLQQTAGGIRIERGRKAVKTNVQSYNGCLEVQFHVIGRAPSWACERGKNQFRKAFRSLTLEIS